MAAIAKNERQLNFYYHSKTDLGKRALSYIQGSQNPIREIDISQTQVTATQWAELADGLDLAVEDLIDKEHPVFRESDSSGTSDLDEHDWLKYLVNSPEVLKYPIAVRGEDFLLVDEPFLLSKFLEQDSAGLEKPYNKKES